jgi:hypothetical protein
MSNPYDKPMLVSDASSMLTLAVENNDRPYDRAVKQVNNEIVKHWREDMLEPLSSKDGTVSAMEVWSNFELYFNGMHATGLMEQKYIVPLSLEEREYWMTILNGSIESLIALGPFVVNHAWNTLTRDLVLYYAREQFDKVYSKSDEPLTWVKLAKEYQELFRSTHHPYWQDEKFKDAQQKVVAINTNKVFPRI